MKILVTCGYNLSQHSLVLLELLRRRGVEVDTCLVVSMYSVKRIRWYYQQLDTREFMKKLKDRIIGNVADLELSDEMAPILQLKAELGVSDSTVRSYCRRHNVNCSIVSDLNSKKALAHVDRAGLAVYAGGGILKKAFLDSFGVGVLNCHGGLLPDVRGINASEWSVLLGLPVANTLHFMVRQVDLGPIIEVRCHDFSMCSSIDQLRGKAAAYAMHDLAEITEQVIVGGYSTSRQRKKDGKQYYTMHPILKSIVNGKLAKSAT